MVGKTLGRIALMMAMISASAASAPAVSVASAATPTVASFGATNVVPASRATALERASEAGKGWGSMLACSACILGAGVVIAGGPASIIVAINTPGSALALLACASSCYDAFQ